MKMLLALSTAAILPSGPSVLPTPTLPCTCIDVPLQEHIAKTDVVFSGIVIAQDTVEVQFLPTEYSSTFKTKIEVRNTILSQGAYKGAVSDTVNVVTAASGAACGYSFTVGNTYLIYAYIRDGVLSTSICSATKPLANAGADLRLLTK
jgi:predicted glutamine amidotransferase